MILFIEDADCRFPGDCKFLQNIFYGGDLVFKVRVADIDDMEKDVRFMKFIEGGPEGGEEFLRQVPDNPTVSVIIASRSLGKRRRELLGSSVAKSRFSVKTSLFVRAFKRVDFPALV